MRDGRGAEEGTGVLVCADQTFDVLAQLVGTAAGLLQKGPPVLARARDRGVEQRVDACASGRCPSREAPAQAPPPIRPYSQAFAKLQSRSMVAGDRSDAATHDFVQPRDGAPPLLDLNVRGPDDL